ncbi:MAG: hypothetical protein IT345_12330 [Trueperaceae bacterium]|nr:hypothetical protein [Trueperaceae bacterium]HNQ98550.1 hypothetical protein [Trueperaceae bacterium]
MAGVHLREVLRNPWTLFAGLALVGISLAFSGRGSAVGLVSLVAVLQLYLPPLTVVVAAPLLTRRETWAFWAALPRPAGAAYRGATVGIAVGLLLPLLAGTGAAAAILGLGALELLLLIATVAALVVLWTCTVSFLSALTLDPTRAMALGLAAWALLVLAYGPTVVGLAVAFADYPLGPFMLLAIALNPTELLRVGLLQALGVPVLVGPVGKLVVDTVPNGGFGLGVAAVLMLSALLLWLSGLWFARRDR